MRKLLNIHPILFAIFPILFLFSHNIEQVSTNQIVIPIVVTILFTLVCWILLSLFIKNKQKAELIISVFLLWFFSYGHFFKGIIGFSIWFIIVTLSVIFFIKVCKNLIIFTKLFNIISFTLVLISIVNIYAYKFVKRYIKYEDFNLENIEVKHLDLEKSYIYPNIYYIILDGYARADILKEIYNYDNTELLDYLIQKGFYIAEKSSSNYVQTYLSIPSSLNFKYHDDLVEQIGVESDNFAPLQYITRYNRVSRFLRRQGYVFIAFSSGYSPTEMRNADFYMTCGWSLNEFQNIIINITPIPEVLNRLLNSQYILHRKRIIYIFESLVDLPELKVPIFVFAHILAPHPPFVFGKQGEKVNTKRKFTIADGSHLVNPGGLSKNEYIENYRNQITFINNKIKITVAGILENSVRPTVIIIQSDHGPGSMLDWEDIGNTNLKERFSILNAYYLPQSGYLDLYDEITPVNTFRIVFNNYFGTDFELLPDESYYSTWSCPYKLINVNNKINSDVATKYSE